MPFKDHFQTLRVSHRATPQQVQKAYYDRLKFFHPDYFQDDPPRRAIAETETKCLNEAYEVLGKPGERERYITEWERCQNPSRRPERSLALEQSLADAKADLNMARLQLTELKSMLEQRERELEAANLGVRQGYQRVTHLQEAAQTFQESARQLQAQLLERDLELQRAQGRADGLDHHLKRLQAELDQAREDSLQAQQAASDQRNRLAEAERQLAERKRELEVLQRKNSAPGDRETQQDTAYLLEDAISRSQTQAEELRRAVGAGAEALRLRQAQLEESASELQQLRQSASLAQDRAREQQALLDVAATQIRSLQERLELAEGDLRRNRAAAPARAGAAVGEELEEETRWQKGQIQELAAALAQRTEEARQAQLRSESQEERIHILESAGLGATRPGTNRAGMRSFVMGIDRATGWLGPQRATAVMTGLLLALCAVAVILVLLTVSIDLPALASGLSRLGPTLAGLGPR